MYREYVKGRKQKEFFSAHQSDLELYEAATKELREIFGDEKLPVVQSLKEEKGQLTARKQEQYETFKVLRTQWVELSKLAKNRDSMIVPDKQTARDNKKDI